MSKAPETIYLNDHEWHRTEREDEHDQKYVRADLAYGYSMWRGANTKVEQLRSVLTNISRNASVMTAHQIETMARDALGDK